MPEYSRYRLSAVFGCSEMPDRAVSAHVPRSSGGEHEPSVDSSTLHVFRNSGTPEDIGGGDRLECPGAPEVSEAGVQRPPDHRSTLS